MQKKKVSSQPLVEQWEEYVVPNLSRFPATDEKVVLSGNRMVAALDKVGSHFLRRGFRRDACGFVEELMNCLLSTVVSRSVIGQGMSCFCPAIVVCEDGVTPFPLFNKLLDGILEEVWTRGSKIEAYRAEYQSFVLEQRQLERSFTMSRMK